MPRFPKPRSVVLTGVIPIVLRLGAISRGDTRVEPIIEDKLTLSSWPKFLHPWPRVERLEFSGHT